MEADRAALDCLAKNCPDKRVQAEWQDVARWRAPQKLDAVIMNPPFHIGRAAEPRLGQDFIRAAAANLTPLVTMALSTFQMRLCALVCTILCMILLKRV